MTRHEVELHDEFDASDDFHAPGPPCPGIFRTLRIDFWKVSGGFKVHAYGRSLSEDSAMRVIGHLKSTPEEIQELVNNLLKDWATYLVDVRDAHSYRRHPFADRFDFRELADELVDAMWCRLADAGHVLFQQLFNGDPALREVGERIARVLRSGEQTITVCSDDVVVPWAMLYVPEQIWQPLPPKFPVELDAFIGYRHRVEQTFDIEERPDTAIRVDTQVDAGAYYDISLDRIRDDGQPDAPVVGPVLGVLAQFGRVQERTSKDELRIRLRADGADDHLVYFCCHCTDAERLMFGLDDSEAVSPADLRSWLFNGFSRGPLVVVNACKAGAANSNSLTDFVPMLLQRRANCVVGPVVNVPTVFAGEFGRRLFELILPRQRDVRFGTAMRKLVREFARDHRNPLGLAYSLYQGIDGHFCRWETDAEPAADRR
ncbi:hypothetical protein ACFO1B_18520 [Dactylosporangium siamense]|uniref:CHAT domain-containing protein n=1 Tax=Dactylosporangium siamense TaxID=685454 RepID=A0A919U9L3_9ACTN|nr:hypothetical protein [Dactylosporangium siamense]GIG43870.1 hypothetical protein Dsi01nite_019110 [Dactylosporangium siamense]